MLGTLRAADAARWDQSVHRYIASKSRWWWDGPLQQFAEAVLRYWRSLQEIELTKVSRSALAREDQGIEVRHIFGGDGTTDIEEP